MVAPLRRVGIVQMERVARNTLLEARLPWDHPLSFVYLLDRRPTWLKATRMACFGILRFMKSVRMRSIILTAENMNTVGIGTSFYHGCCFPFFQLGCEHALYSPCWVVA